jgi:hypothetical protein
LSWDANLESYTLNIERYIGLGDPSIHYMPALQKKEEEKNRFRKTWHNRKT